MDNNRHEELINEARNTAEMVREKHDLDYSLEGTALTGSTASPVGEHVISMRTGSGPKVTVP